jgi:hypothetical protein
LLSAFFVERFNCENNCIEDPAFLWQELKQYFEDIPDIEDFCYALKESLLYAPWDGTYKELLDSVYESMQYCYNDTCADVANAYMMNSRIDSKPSLYDIIRYFGDTESGAHYV